MGSSGTSLAAPFFDPLAEAGIAPVADAHLPAQVMMTDETGRAVPLADYLGGPPLLVAPVQFACPNLCGLTLDGLFAGLAGSGLVGGRDYRLLAISFDSREGMVEANQLLSKLMARHPAVAPAAHFLTGPPEAVARVLAGLGVKAGWDAGHGQYAHISAVALLTPRGRLSRWLMGVAFDPRGLRLGLAEAGAGRLGRLGEQVLMLCYGYDPAHGRYGLAVRRILMAGGALTVGGLGLFILWAKRREGGR